MAKAKEVSFEVCLGPPSPELPSAAPPNCVPR